MFSMLPVERSSITKTSSPRSMYASERCDPIKPAPPVINTRKLYILSNNLRVWSPKPKNYPLSLTSDALLTRQTQRIFPAPSHRKGSLCLLAISLLNSSLQQTHDRARPKRVATLHLQSIVEAHHRN